MKAQVKFKRKEYMQRFCLEVTGNFACFTRPEMKVERVSYDVITPSAARAIFEAILWKPAMRWHIRAIEVLTPICWMSLRRNEVGNKISVGNVRTAMKDGRGQLGIYVEDDRQQRAGLLLRDVCYRLHADLEVLLDRDPEGTPAKYHDMFVRRASKGQCFHQPYLGCREFAAHFRLVNPVTEPSQPIPDSPDLGWMLYDLDFSEPDNPRPRFFHARLEHGVLRVPAWDSPEVIG
jgi:CRISPR-associated protein Cas5d